MAQEVIFLYKFLENFGFNKNGPNPIFADNENAFIGLKALSVAAIVQSILISAFVESATGPQGFCSRCVPTRHSQAYKD